MSDELDQPAVGEREVGELRELFAGEPGAVFERFMSEYLGEGERSLGRLRAGLESGDAAAAERAAHALKGASASLGARRLVELCRRIEDSARGGRLAGLEPVAAAAQAEFGRVRGALLAQPAREARS